MDDKVKERNQVGLNSATYNRIFEEISNIAKGKEIDMSEQSTHITTNRSTYPK